MAKGEKWKAIHSSKRMNWGTPRELFDKLDKEFNFKLDAAADDSNHRCDRYLTEFEDSLNQPKGKWSELSAGGSVWLNPPYGRSIGSWIDKAILESREGCRVVVLVFACTDTRWFKRAWASATEVRFIHGRIRFIDPDTGEPGSPAPKGSCILIFEKPSREHFAYPRLPICSILEM